MSAVITTENLSKVYKRRTLREGQVVVEDFWALKDLSISIDQGDVVGFIGKNGAGKSTLLKILSRITTPTKGTATMRGRVGSLLEVGTGFHMELTGRENIYLNGKILGMSNAEINRKLDEIVDFSGIADFLETPVKRYSSGMQTRLGFAVAATMETEILIVDEVLAVGDAEFQKRCLNKMSDIGRSGRTVLFVSHNMNAIMNLCNRCIWIKNGQEVLNSYDTDDAIKKYLEDTIPATNSTVWQSDQSEAVVGDDTTQFTAFRLVDAKGRPALTSIHGNDKVSIEIDFLAEENNLDLQIGFALYDASMNLLMLSYHNDTKDSARNQFAKGKNTLKARVPTEILNDGEYIVQLVAEVRKSHALLSPNESAVTIGFSVEGNTHRSLSWDTKRPSLVAPILEWEQH